MASSHHPHLQKSKLSAPETISLLYHDIFNYPLTRGELDRWLAGESLTLRKARPSIEFQEDCYYLKNRGEVIKKRVENTKSSKQKIKYLSLYEDYFESQTNILMVGITGSLAMLNASQDSDIDLMIITKRGKMWTTRLSLLLSLKRKGVPLRKPNDPDEKNKFCFNIWLDETKLSLPKAKETPTQHMR